MARAVFQQVLMEQPRHPRANECLAFIEVRAGNPVVAHRHLALACEDGSASAQALFLLGSSWLQREEFAQAAACFERATQRAGDFFEGWHELGTARSRLGDVRGALDAYGKAAELNPRSFQVFFNLGRMHDELGEFAQAIESYGRAIALQADFAAAWTHRGIDLSELGRHDEALANHERATALDPADPEAWTNQAVTLGHLGRHAEALVSHARALALQPDQAHYWSNKAVTLEALRRPGEALSCHDRAVSLAPGSAEAWTNRAHALHLLGRNDDALAQLARAIELQPTLARAWADRGIVLATSGRHAEAVAHYERALQLEPGHAQTLTNQGMALSQLGRRVEALACFQEAMRHEPATDYLLGHVANARMSICDWTDWQTELETLAGRIRAGAKAIAPFSALALFDAPDLALLAARTWVADKHPPAGMEASIPARPPGAKIVLGYFSADFHDHATSYLMAEFFERHDRERFELVAFSFGPDLLDNSRRRLLAAFDRFIDVRSQADEAVARLSREVGVDVAIDLKGFTLESRPGIFACRAAPVQVSYLGYPGTTGAAFMDYVLADHQVIPAGDEPFYTEKVIRLPHSYQVNDTRRPVAGRRWTRQEAGLPEQGTVFCCFNASYKIAPSTFDSWMRILRRVEGSVLWLYEGDRAASTNLRREAAARGVAPDRLVFAGHLPAAEHLARYQLADLFLDTLPYNAHTTASDALWRGVPVLTLRGKAFAGRVAASLLHAAGLSELVTDSAAAYENLAVALALEPARLGELRRRLAAQNPSAPLFDTARTTRAIEQAYMEIVHRQRSGLPPDHLDIRP